MKNFSVSFHETIYSFDDVGEFSSKPYVVHYRHMIGFFSSFDSQLLISNKSAIRILSPQLTNASDASTSSKIQIRIISKYSIERPRFFLSFSPLSSVVARRSNRKSNRTIFFRATDHATTPISADGPTFFRYYPFAPGIHRKMEADDLDGNSRAVLRSRTESVKFFS